MDTSQLYDTSKLFSPEISGSSTLCLIILNCPITSAGHFQNLWQKSSYRICADGGANRLHDAFMSHAFGREPRDYIPDAIVGDFDSLRIDVQRFYEKLGSEIVKDEDQYSTDFGKSLDHLRSVLSSSSEFESQPANVDIIVLGSISGRVDQGIGLLGELYREAHRSQSNTRLWMVSESNVSWLLPPGNNVLLGFDVTLSDDKRKIFAPHVGILPLYGPSVITTKGLEWDVTDWETKMGANVSTSNHIIGNEVSVRTSEWVLFTVELAILE